MKLREVPEVTSSLETTAHAQRRRVLGESDGADLTHTHTQQVRTVQKHVFLLLLTDQDEDSPEVERAITPPGSGG